MRLLFLLLPCLCFADPNCADWISQNWLKPIEVEIFDSTRPESYGDYYYRASGLIRFIADPNSVQIFACKNFVNLNQFAAFARTWPGIVIPPEVYYIAPRLRDGLRHSESAFIRDKDTGIRGHLFGYAKAEADPNLPPCSICLPLEWWMYQEIRK